MRLLSLFMLSSGVVGMTSLFIGLVLANYFGFGDIGLFVGGWLVGSVVCVLLSYLDVRLGMTSAVKRGSVALGTVIGLTFAAVVSFFTAFFVIVPLASFGLVGLGAVIGDQSG